MEVAGSGYLPSREALSLSILSSPLKRSSSEALSVSQLKETDKLIEQELRFKGKMLCDNLFLQKRIFTDFWKNLKDCKHQSLGGNTSCTFHDGPTWEETPCTLDPHGGGHFVHFT